jgi:anti-sigma regulatory factor (Ser/Thr protein kinase)
MKRANKQNQEIIEFILNHVDEHPTGVSSMAVKKYGLSRAAINNYMKRLAEEGFLEATGNTKARHYKLKSLVDETFTIELSHGLAEDVIWRYRIAPLMKNVKQNVIDICQYCFTEMLNNAIDHSASKDALITYRQSHNKIRMMVIDHGVGIFEKIQNDFQLPDSRMALLELSKGKLTSDKVNHSGQGIFFTSRMLDTFKILSGYLFYTRKRLEDDEWLIETEDESEYEKGTNISMEIEINTGRTTREVFNKYQGADLSFRKAHVPISLGKYPGEQLVSRSQAKRVLARFDSFTEVMLDFKGVPDIGQAFADEIFRVFKNAHPDIDILAINKSPGSRKNDRIR